MNNDKIKKFLELNDFQKTCVIFYEAERIDYTAPKDDIKKYNLVFNDKNVQPHLEYARDKLLSNPNKNIYNESLFKFIQKYENPKNLLDQSIANNLRIFSKNMSTFIKASPVFLTSLQYKEKQLIEKDKELSIKEKQIEQRINKFDNFVKQFDELKKHTSEYNLAKLFNGLTKEQIKKVWTNATKEADDLRKINSITKEKENININENIHTRSNHRHR